MSDENTKTNEPAKTETNETAVVTQAVEKVKPVKTKVEFLGDTEAAKKVKFAADPKAAHTRVHSTGMVIHNY